MSSAEEKNKEYKSLKTNEEVKSMPENQNNDFEYIPPKIEIFNEVEVIEKLGPVLSCSGYGGATSGC